MKRVAAIVLSLMFIWLQVVAATQTPFAGVTRGCDCCACKKADCCVSETTPDAQPPLALPITSVASHFSLIAPAFVTWTLPVTAPSLISSLDFESSAGSAVPLFTRHCALLI